MSRGFRQIQAHSERANLELLDKLMATNAKLFIGGHSLESGKKGKFIAPILSNVTPAELLLTLQETFGSDAVTHEDLHEFKLDVEKMLLHFTDHIVDMIKAENNDLFNRLIQYDKDGTFRMFEVYYSRLIQGKFSIGPTLDPTVAALITRINDLYAHYIKELAKLPKYNENGNIEYQYVNSAFVSPVLETKENFMVLLDLLLMFTACEYYGDKPHFSTETVIKDSIKKIRDILFSLFNAIPYRNRTNWGNVYVFNTWRTDPERFKQIALHLEYPFTMETISTLLKHVSYESRQNKELTIVDDALYPQQRFYFDTLIELFGYLNSFEQMYETLKLNALNTINNDASAVDGDAIQQFTFMLEQRNIAEQQVLVATKPD